MGSGVMGGIVTSAMNVMGGLCRARTRVPIELDGGPPSFVGLDADTSVTELRRRLEDRVNHIGAPSAEVPSHHKCLAALLGSEDTVSPSPVTTVRPFELSKLKVCSSEHDTVDLAPLLDTGARRFLEQPELIIKGDDDVDMEDAPDLYTDPAFFRTRPPSLPSLSSSFPGASVAGFWTEFVLLVFSRCSRNWECYASFSIAG